MHHAKTVWRHEGMAFDIQLNHGHSVRIDSKPPLGTDTGPGPKSLLLASLTGCSGIDVVDILAKMRVSFDEFYIEATAELTDEIPKVYKSIHLVYCFKGGNIKTEKAEKAAQLSLNKYCGVAAMLRKHCPITCEVRLDGGE